MDRKEMIKKLAEHFDVDPRYLKAPIAEMTEFIKMQPIELQEYDEQLVRRLIEKITVFDNKLTFEFKSCVEIEIEI